MIVTRRTLIGGAGAAGLLATVPGCGRGGSAASGGDAKTLVIGQDPEPIALASAGSIDAGASVVSVKIFDRLFNFDRQGRPVPQLALGARVSPDGLAVALDLRRGVAWHDGKPFTSADVAYSIEQVWKVHLPRSQLAFANLTGVETPAPETAVLRFSRPAPYILSSLSDGSAQVVPRHLYEGKDVLSNPVNLAPVGTGPWMFDQWERGNFVSLKRNPHYWGGPEPYLDRLIFRFLASGAPTVAALETGAIDYIGVNLPLNEIDRLSRNPKLWVREFGPDHSPNFAGFGFNLNRPVLRDRRVRQAFAHAIDRDALLQKVWLGKGLKADSPISPTSEWHAPGLPTYPYDLRKAEALLDEAGLRRGPDGIRLRLQNDVMPPSSLNFRAAQLIRQSLAQIGVDLTLRSEGLPAYLKRIFTTRDWDTNTYGTGSDFDPALGIQRFYWSKSIQIGVPFTNPTHYSSPEVDRLLEAAQVETDHEARRRLYFEVQQRIQTDLPLIPTIFPSSFDAGSRRFTIPAPVRTQNLADVRPAGA